MNDTLKHASFYKEPMGNKLVTKLSGVGPALGRRLADHGITQAQQLYEKLESLNFNKVAFQEWMVSECNARVKHAADCFETLDAWRLQFKEEQSAQAPSTSSRSANPRTPARKRRISPAPASKPVKLAKKQSDKTPVQSPEKDDPITAFFMSSLATVKSFPRPLQLKVKEQVFNIIMRAEREQESEAAPVASTTQDGGGAGNRRV